jgi:hypothetical protein
MKILYVQDNRRFRQTKTGVRKVPAGMGAAPGQGPGIKIDSAFAPGWRIEFFFERNHLIVNEPLLLIPREASFPAGEEGGGTAVAENSFWWK